jgi:hypothetical protein
MKRDEKKEIFDPRLPLSVVGYWRRRVGTGTDSHKWSNPGPAERCHLNKIE